MSVKLGNGNGTASGAGGEANAHLGVDAGDCDNGGDEDLCITALLGQGSARYVHEAPGPSKSSAWARTSASPACCIPVSVQPGSTQNLGAQGSDDRCPLQQRNPLLRNLGNGRFEMWDDMPGDRFTTLRESEGR